MKKTLALVLGLSLAAAAAQAEELLVSINSPHAMTQGAGLVLANTALAQKANVRILLCDAAGDLALANQEGIGQTVFKPRDVTPHQLLQGAIKGGARVEVCALYLPNTGKQPADLLEGVSPAKPDDVMGYLLKGDVRTLSF